jgi:hypothetical protein
MENKNLKSLSGGKIVPKTSDEFQTLVEAEVHHNLALLDDEFSARRESMLRSAETKIAEYELMAAIIEANTAEQNGQVNPALLMKIETQGAGLNYDNVAASYQLLFWQKQYGEQMLAPVLAEIIGYFVKQFQVKESLTHEQAYLLATKLIAFHPHLRIKELIFVLNNALNGLYGPTYQRIGIDTILSWLSKFFEDSSLHLETKMANGKPDESRGEMPWQVLERRTKQYQDEIKRKAETNTKVFAAEKRKREIEDELARLQITKKTAA